MLKVVNYKHSIELIEQDFKNSLLIINKDFKSVYKKEEVVVVSPELIVVPEAFLLDPVDQSSNKALLTDEVPDISSPDSPTGSPITQATGIEITGYKPVMLENDPYYELIFDFTKDYNISRVYFYDGAGSPSIRIYKSTTDIFNFTLIATLDQSSFNQNKFVDIAAENQNMRYMKLDTDGTFPAYVIPYGTPATGAVSTFTEPPIQRLTPQVDFDKYVGVCSFHDTPTDLNGEFGRYRNYMEARWLADDSTGEFVINPSNFGGGRDLIQEMLDQAATGVLIDLNIKGNPRFLDAAYDNGDAATGNFNNDFKPLDSVGADATDPLNFGWYSRLAYNAAAVFGSVAVNINTLNNVKAGQTITTGNNVAHTLSFWNEQDTYWEGTKGYFRYKELGAFLSAVIDGHKGAIAGGGALNADPSMKIIAPGTIDWYPEYVYSAFKYAAYIRNETLEQFLVNIHGIELHHYSNDGGGQGGDRTIGISPEADDLLGKMTSWREWTDRYLPNKELQFGEWGYDENSLGSPNDQYAPAIINGSMSATKAAWMQQGYLMGARTSLDVMHWYQIKHTSTGTGRFGSSGFVTNGFSKLETWYSFKAMKDFLTGFRFTQVIAGSNATVQIYQFDNSITSETIYAVWLNTSVDGEVTNEVISVDASFNSASQMFTVDLKEAGEKQGLSVTGNQVIIPSVKETPTYVKMLTAGFTIPLDVTNLYLTDVGGTISMKWDNVSEIAQEIRVYRQVNGGGYSLYDTLSPIVSTYTDSTVSAGTAYSYSIRPYNTAGEATGVIETATTEDLTGYSVTETALIDFRDAGTSLDPVPTYNIYNDTAATINVLDNLGVDTGADLSVVSGFTYFPSTGDTTGDNTGIVPDNALKEMIRTAGATTSGLLRLSNMGAFPLVKITVIASVTFTADHKTLVKVGDNEKWFDSLDNTANALIFPAVAPDISGNIDIEFNTIDGFNPACNALIIEFYDLTADVTAPIFSNVSVNGITASTADFNAEINEAGTIYWAAFPTATAQQTAVVIEAGTGAIAFGNIATLGSVIETDTATGLAASTPYKIHYFGRDGSANESTPAITGEFSTLAAVSVIDANVTHRYRWDSIETSLAAAAGVGEEAHTWLDISANNDHLVWAGAGSPPNVSAGYVEIGTANDIEWFNDTFTSLVQPNEVWLVMENLTGEDFDTFIQGLGATIQANSSNLRLSAGVTATFTGGRPTNGQQVILRAVYDGINSELHIDGVANGSNPQDAGSNNITTLKIGTSSGGANWRCSEMLVFNGSQDANAAGILAELQGDYGL